MTRNGKIARLPRYVREELNERIRNGQSARKLVDWLMEQDEVFDLLEEHGFEGITDQNISEWKAGGYQCWLENQEARELVMEMALKSRDLGEETLEENLGQCVGNLVMVEFIKMMKVLVQKEKDPQKRWAQLERVNRELARLRGSNARNTWAGIQQKRSDWAEEDREEAAEEKHAAWVKKQRLAEYRAPLSVAILASGKEPKEAAWYMAAREVEIAQDLPRGFLDQEHQGGFWYWDEEDDQWRWQRKEEKAKDATSNTQPPTSNEGKAAVAAANKDGELKTRTAQASGVQASEKTPDPTTQTSKQHQKRVPKGKKQKHPTSNIQQPTSNGGKKKAKVVEGQKARVEGFKSAPTNVGDYKVETAEDVQPAGEQTGGGDGAQGTARPTSEGRMKIENEDKGAENGGIQAVSNQFQPVEGGGAVCVQYFA